MLGTILGRRKSVREEVLSTKTAHYCTAWSARVGAEIPYPFPLNILYNPSMRIHLISVGNKMPRWVEEGYQEYAKRLPAECLLQLLEIPSGHRGKSADIKCTLRDERRADAESDTTQLPGSGVGCERQSLEHRATLQPDRQLDEQRSASGNTELVDRKGWLRSA